ncbi:MAG: S-adenosylmethionine:tRNA ribosyltransferase-isomerase [Bacteroidales bacterium]|nr:S-adenosylmethionine:tRNA ribosyltransferase-isomerase [Bacteroidales bacterium]
MQRPNISIEEYDYYLPEENIAQYPVAERDLSNLLVAIDENFVIEKFRLIHHHLPSDAVLIYNDTKVIPARLFFQKSTGARIEILLLNPIDPPDYQTNFQTCKEVIWEVLIGNASKWKDEVLSTEWLTNGTKYSLRAEKIDKNKVRLSWSPSSLCFSEILEMIALVPLPPYIQRPVEKKDKETYQTIYAHHPGSVAAPTAGLHFTPQLLETIQTQKNIQLVPITLHVGIGTFKPLKTDIHSHEMHKELINIPPTSLKLLLEHSNKPWIVVGTTSLRALESLYFYLLSILLGQPIQTIPQWIGWEIPESRWISRTTLLEQLPKLNLLDRDIQFDTQLMILPGKPIQMADYLITNFHQPRSTLLLLVDAFSSISWKKIYAFALENKLRFLSYGDACLLKNKNSPF